jgi:hypothetical protein
VANLFDVANAPTTEPKKLVIGDFVQWKRTDLVDDYPVATHSAEIVARSSHAGSTEFKIAATENAAYYLFTAASSVTETYVAGHYHWQLDITETSSGNRIVVDNGTFDVIEDLDVNGADPRSHAEIMITKIESILSGKADSDVSNYSINGRSLTKFSFAELMEARENYRAEYQREINKELAENGEKTGQTILVRF